VPTVRSLFQWQDNAVQNIVKYCTNQAIMCRLTTSYLSD